MTLVEAETAANLIVSVLQQFLIIDLYYSGYNSYDDWRGEWVEIIEIHYRGHTDWTSCLLTYEEAIPREMGGIAETVDVSEANHLRFSTWYAHGMNEFIGEIGFSWNLDWDNLTGSHSFSLKDVFHISAFTPSPQATDWMNIYLNLPDVSSLSISPWANNSYLQMYQDYHPNTYEPWNKDNTYTIYFNIEPGNSISDFTLNFDYDVQYWGLVPMERAWYEVDPRGYEYLQISYNGPNAKLTSIIPLDEALLVNVSHLHFEYYPSAYEVATHSPIWLEINFKDDLDHQTEADLIADFFETFLGITFDHNNSWTNWYWDYNLQMDFKSMTYEYEEDVYTFAEFQPIYLSSLAYNHSSMINSSSYALDFDCICWDINQDFRYDVFSYEVRIESDALDEYTQTPTKAYPESTLPQDHSYDVLSLFGWSSLPYSTSAYRMEIELRLPMEEGEDLVVNPSDPNGWGYHYWYNEYHWSQYRYTNIMFNYYVDVPYETDQYGVKTTPVTNWSGTFNFAFQADTVDVEPPGIGGLCYWNATHSGWDYDSDASLSGEVLFGVDVWDDHDQFWNTTTNDWETRFTGSGVYNVTGKLFYGALTANIEGLFIPVTFAYNSTAGRYTVLVNLATDNFADGDWIFTVESADNDDNFGWNWYDFVIDNYDDSIYLDAAFVEWIAPTPANDSDISGTISININTTDDVGIYLVVLWVNFGGYILDDPDEDGVYIKDYDTSFNFEGPMVIIAEVWDNEGHYTSIVRYFNVDNFPSGGPPTVTVISPTTSETIYGNYLVEATVVDDVGIKAVTLKVDDRSPLVMTYNATSNNYEILYNTMQVSDGGHIFAITAIDDDENTHIITVAVNVIVDNGGVGTGEGDPPEYNLINVPINQTPEDLATQIVTVTDTSKAIVGSFIWEIDVKDDIGISQVVLTIDDDVNTMSGSFAGPDIWSEYTYDFDSTELYDGAHIAIISITDIDENQHTVEIYFGFTTSNGNTQEQPTVGLEGFSSLWALLTIIPIAFAVTRIKKRRSIKF